MSLIVQIPVNALPAGGQKSTLGFAILCNDINYEPFSKGSYPNSVCLLINLSALYIYVQSICLSFLVLFGALLFIGKSSSPFWI